jgi:tetrahydromethanopterin S-methyltransferase subunit F
MAVKIQNQVTIFIFPFLGPNIHMSTSRSYIMLGIKIYVELVEILYPTSAWYRHRILHNMWQIQLGAISMNHKAIDSFVENVEPSWQLLERGHTQQFRLQSHTRIKETAINIITLLHNLWELISEKQSTQNVKSILHWIHTVKYPLPFQVGWGKTFA